MAADGAVSELRDNRRQLNSTTTEGGTLPFRGEPGLLEKPDGQSREEGRHLVPGTLELGEVCDGAAGPVPSISLPMNPTP